jgi:hypothetical protein
MSRQPKSGHAAGRRLEIASCILALVVLDPDAAYPAAVRIGVERLLDRCPELGDEWVATCELMESRDAAEIGLYNVIGQVVKPALGKALGLPGDLLGITLSQVVGRLPEWRRMRTLSTWLGASTRSSTSGRLP